MPAGGEQRIALTYSQVLPYESGLYRLVYPLKTGEKASRTLEDFTVSVRLSSKVSLKNIYSPSHEIGVSRKGDHEAVIGFEEDGALLDRDFVLYYGVSDKRFGLNLLTYAEPDKDGYFMMLIAPAVATPGRPSGGARRHLRFRHLREQCSGRKSSRRARPLITVSAASAKPTASTSSVSAPRLNPWPKPSFPPPLKTAPRRTPLWRASSPAAADRDRRGAPAPPWR